MNKCLKYRLYPTRKQQRLLQAQLDECRWLYNHLLEQRKNSWEQEKKSIGYFNQCKYLIDLKKERESLNNVYSQVLQNVVDRVDKAFQSFFRRVKSQNGKVGYPRFKGFDRYDSFTYKQANFGWKIENNSLKLSKIGSIKIKIHRSIIGTLKTCTIRRQNNKWYACFSVECANQPLPHSDKAVGIDVGLGSFATLSTNEKIDNPRFFKTDQKTLTKAQRKLSNLEKGIPERKRAKKVVARIHERISNRRHNFIHQTARKLVNRFGVVCIEKLNIQNLQNGNYRSINRSIGDVAWGQFANVLLHKAEDAGRQFIAVNPKGTSQRCSQCGIITKKDLSTRWHDCPICNCHLHRDYNASLNILSLGLQTLGLSPGSPRL
jgi:putative transposase